jgi:diadenosine tetraphosphatase ApaH/serine/threonine PP2A family protein phosphatase
LDLVNGSRYLINPGAVGQPRDGDWRAAFAIYDEAEEQVTFFRTPYDVAAAQAAIREAQLPERLAARLSTGR